MNKRNILTYFLAFVALVGQAQVQNNTSLLGSWSGKLNAGAMSLRLVLNLEQADGYVKVSMDSPDQGVKGIPATKEFLSDDSLAVKIEQIGMTYRARLKDGKLDGTFSQNGFSISLILTKGVTEVKRPQALRPPYPYNTEEVTFRNDADGATLAGTLTWPVGYSPESKRKPIVVLLVTGSGQQNRDEEIFEHKPFLVIADYLARHGIATLRYDDRATAASVGGEVQKATTEDFMRDAAAGLDFLRSKNSFAKVGILGHSEGGSIAFMLGSRQKTDFIVSLAGPGVKGDTLLVVQGNRILELSGQPANMTVAQYRQDPTVQQMPWLKWFVDYDPSDDIRNTRCPVLALNGDRDCQVVSSQNLQAIRQLLPLTNQNVIKEYPALNHLFQHCTTGLPTEYGQIEETISPEVLSDIAQWINGLQVEESIVSTTSGQVSGTIQEGTMAFLGIPYAKVERFMPPLPVEKWEGVRACDHWGPQVMQQTWGRQLTEEEMSEKNSCVLNVWTTDVKAKKPVMLWLHGGGFDSGTSEWDPGMQLAKKDVVVVSINHRLNILGFLDLSAVSDKYKYSGNVGMLDVVQALEWIRDNIANFGGDPQNVTVFGESGGGGKVGTLMCMPAAKGLFHKAIIMSGTILNVNNHEMTQTLGKAVLKELGISEADVDKLKDVPYQELYDAGQRAMAASIGTRKPGTPMMWGFGPTPDGEVLLQQPFQPDFATISDEIPLMIGTTFNELQRLHYNRQLTLDDARKELQPTFGDETEAYIAAFAKTYPDYTPQDLLSIDWLFRPKTIITADARSSRLSSSATHQPSPLYMYMFTWRSPLNNGSIHGHELKFCFNTLHRATNDLPLPTAEDLELADLMSSAWAQFAHNGNPNIDALPEWHPYTSENGEMMIFDYKRFIRHNPDRALEEIINRHCFKQLDAFRTNKKR